MTQWKLTLAYDGTPFRGWQIQPDLPTVQGLLADAIHRTVGERVLPQGSGRTDAGVHALGQVASFALAAPIPAANLHNALNRCLPPSIRVLEAQIVSSDFHARHSALRKTYEYRIFSLKPALYPRSDTDDTARVPHPSQSPRDGWEVNHSPTADPICPPVLAPYVWPCPWPLDLAALSQAAAHVLGTHDFTTFAASDPDLATRTQASHPSSTIHKPSQTVHEACHSERSPSQRYHSERSEESQHLAREFKQPVRPNTRSITHSAWHTQDGLLIYRVTATGFLHHMVRNLVGTFVQCGAHRLAPDSIPNLLAAGDRSSAGPTAPPTGLFLVNVEYPDLEPST